MDKVSTKLQAGLTWAALGLWALALVVVCAYLLAGHLLTLPSPQLDNPVLARALAERRPQPTWAVFHILYGDCGCSRRVIRHLEARGPSALAYERVVLVGPDEGDEARLLKRGFSVEAMAPAELLSSLDVAAAPLLVIQRPDGKLAYVGGYTDRKRGPSINDLTILSSVISGELAQPRPVFGCAVSAALAQQVDPLGLR